MSNDSDAQHVILEASTQARAEAAEKELAAVKERAWALMEEKDSQLQAARVGLCILAPNLFDMPHSLCCPASKRFWSGDSGVWLQAQKNHAAEDCGDVDSPLPLSHSATMSTVQAALPHSGQITEGSGESERSQHNGNTTETAALQVLLLSLSQNVHMCQLCPEDAMQCSMEMIFAFIWHGISGNCQLGCWR